MNYENKKLDIINKYEIKHPDTQHIVKDASKNIIILETLTEKTDSNESFISNSDDTQTLEKKSSLNKLTINTTNDISKCDTKLAFIPSTPVIRLSFSSIDLTPPPSPPKILSPSKILKSKKAKKEEKVTCCTFIKSFCLK
tara:strand:+ start:561 stop:980 length:420 start_codon:yes stop_codon:yes gene_type:complete